MAEDAPESTVPQGEGECPSKPQRRVGRLDTIKRVRKEMVQVYRDMHEGRMSSQDATRRAFVLQTIQKAIESQVLEHRLKAIEKTLERQPVNGNARLSRVINGSH